MLLLTLALTFLLLADRSIEQVSKKRFSQIEVENYQVPRITFLRNFLGGTCFFLIVSSRKVLSSWLSYLSVLVPRQM